MEQPVTTSVAFQGPRSKLSGPYHLCGRCDDRTHLSEMKWQRGVLVCNECFDTGIFPLPGQREAAVANALDDSSSSDELMPNPKLVEPQEQSASNDDIIF